MSPACNVISFSDFPAGDDTEDLKRYLAFLRGKRSSEPIKYKESGHGRYSTPYKKLQQVNYDRSFLFGEINSNNVLALLTSSDKESRILTQDHLGLYPGKVVAIIEPRIRGIIIESQNLLITTSEPFIPVPTTEASSTFNELPPYDIENETDIKSFHFETTDLQFKYIVPTVDLCPGSFCDGQSTKENVCLRREKWSSNMGFESICSLTNS